MDRPGKADVKTTGKVLTFPPLGAEAEASSVAGAVNEAHSMRRRRRRAQWFVGIWILIAWILATTRLSFAVTHRQVFGFEASAAFLLVVSMPLMLVRRIAVLVRMVTGALRTARRPPRGKEPAGGGADPPAVRRRPKKGRERP